MFFSNGGGTQTFHLRASSEVERQKWVTALELAKAKVFNCVCVHVKGTVEWPFEADKVFFSTKGAGISSSFAIAELCSLIDRIRIRPLRRNLDPDIILSSSGSYFIWFRIISYPDTDWIRICNTIKVKSLDVNG